MLMQKLKKAILNTGGAALTLGSLLAAATSYADVNLNGSFQGLTADSKKVELLTQPIAGRAGSYLGLLVMLDPKAVVYLIDPLDQNSYAMIPVQVTPDGEIGITDDNPSLVLNVNPTSTGSDAKMVFNIVDANSGNTAGFEGPIRFDGSSKAELTWLDIQSGTYKGTGAAEGVAEISGLNGENQAMVTFSLKELSGSFVLRKKLGTATTGIYTLRAVSVRNTGAELAPLPRKIGFFLSRRGMFWGTTQLFLLVNPQDDEDITQLTLKD